MKVRCINNGGGYESLLTVGRIYDVEPDPDNVSMWKFLDDRGAPYGAFQFRFEPVTDESVVCLCNSDRGPRSCPEHGVRCANPDCDKLCDGISAFSSLKASGEVVHWCSESCWRDSHFAEQPQHDKELLNLAFPCPKADPYAEHRLQEEAEWVYRAQRCSDDASGATARLHAGLESEKVRERVKAFPKQGRNFALKGPTNGR